LKLLVVEVADVIEALRWQSCNSLIEPQTTMLKAHYQDHDTHETQSPQIAQNRPFFTNYKTLRPSQTTSTLDLPHKLVGLQSFFAKNTRFNHTHIVKKKKKDIRRNSFDLELKINFEFVLAFFTFRICPSCLFVFIISFL
jgi:hypothetical protein